MKVLSLILITTILTNCSGEKTSPKLKACIERGISYYKDFGSYPNLSTGESAKTASRKKCLRTNNKVFR